VALDVRLGDESGFDVARALTATRPGLAVVLVSAVDADLGTLWRHAGGA
jgi:hypothetical protein